MLVFVLTVMSGRGRVEVIDDGAYNSGRRILLPCQ